MRSLFAALFLGLAACAGRAGPKAMAPAPEPVWITVNPSTPGLCVPWIGPTTAADVERWRGAVGAIEERDLEAAQGALGDADAPALSAVRGVLALLSGDAERALITLDTLIGAHGVDPCTLAATATALQLVGRDDEAERRVAVARSLAPDDPEIALLFAYLSPIDQAPLAQSALERGAEVAPTRKAFPIALGIAAWSAGDADRAATWLQRAHDLGEHSVRPILLQAYRTSGQLDGYLRFASSLGLPLGDDGLLATAASPMASLRTLWGLQDGEAPTATLHTSRGALRCVLLPDAAPIAVANFIGLATGTQSWMLPDGSALGQGPLYTDLVFHRVIPDFMIQSGDPEGTGRGSPGYRFPDEISEGLRFDRPGRLAMANSGPDTNGSQFFVTEVPVEHLDWQHTIFGQCDDDAVALVRDIARAATETRLLRVEIGASPLEEAP